MLLFYIALGGALGSVCRYLTIGWIGGALGRQFPFGTLAVNILGSFLLGVTIGAVVHFLPRSRELHAFLAIGVLGGFTTFSAFAMDLYLLVERGEFLNAVLYATTSVCFSMIAFFLGMWAFRALVW